MTKIKMDCFFVFKHQTKKSRWSMGKTSRAQKVPISVSSMTLTKVLQYCTNRNYCFHMLLTLKLNSKNKKMRIINRTLFFFGFQFSMSSLNVFYMQEKWISNKSKTPFNFINKISVPNKRISSLTHNFSIFAVKVDWCIN